MTNYGTLTVFIYSKKVDCSFPLNLTAINDRTLSSNLTIRKPIFTINNNG